MNTKNSSSDRIEIIKNLKKAKYISVRDSNTKIALNKIGVNSYLTPDSALIMSDIFPIRELNKKITFDVNNAKDDYIFLQMAINKQPKEIDAFIKKIKAFADNNGYSIICCPIGLASGHEDDVILKEIYNKSKMIKYIHPNNIFDIMYLIASSKIYLGTSLHGLITAQSYNVKFIPINKNVEKLNRYCGTWTSEIGIKESFDYEDWDGINEAVFNWDFSKSERLLSSQKKKVYENLNNIISSILNDD